MKKINRNKVNLKYRISSEACNKSFVLIHNAGGNHQFIANQFEYLSQFGQVLSVDLRGHGESDKPIQEYTVKNFAEDIIYICESNNIQQAVCIGLNYGAAIAIELANISSLASHLILIDPPILMEEWVIRLVQKHINDLHNPLLENFAKSLVDDVIFKTTTENKKMAINAFETTSKKALASTYENLLIWDKTSAEKLAQCKMPMLHIQSSKPFCAEATLQKICPHVVTGKVVNSGPWATLEVSDQVNAMIKRFLS